LPGYSLPRRQLLSLPLAALPIPAAAAATDIRAFLRLRHAWCPYALPVETTLDEIESVARRGFDAVGISLSSIRDRSGQYLPNGASEFAHALRGPIGFFFCAAFSNRSRAWCNTAESGLFCNAAFTAVIAISVCVQVALVNAVRYSCSE
jgi:hypothetical protein